MTQQARTNVSMWIDAQPDAVFQAFVEPQWLTRFWLSSASAPLSLGNAATWNFMVEGASAKVKVSTLEPGKTLAWDWEGSSVRIGLEALDGGTAVTVREEYEGTPDEQVDAALNGTEGFSIVLCDLKTLLETGRSAGLVRAKAKLIEAGVTG